MVLGNLVYGQSQKGEIFINHGIFKDVMTKENKFYTIVKDCSAVFLPITITLGTTSLIQYPQLRQEILIAMFILVVICAILIYLSLKKEAKTTETKPKIEHNKIGKSQVVKANVQNKVERGSKMGRDKENLPREETQEKITIITESFGTRKRSREETQEKTIIIRPSQKFRELGGEEYFKENPRDLYNITRFSWLVDYKGWNEEEFEEIKRDYKQVFCVTNNIVREVYEVSKWEKMTEESFKEMAECKGFEGEKRNDGFKNDCISGKSTRIYFEGKVSKNREKYIRRNVRGDCKVGRSKSFY